MAYDEKDMIEKSLHVIEENKLLCIEEIFLYVEFSSRTFYNHELQNVQTIKDAIAKNKIAMKANLKRKWYQNPNATLQIALYKLIGNDEEVKRLNNKIEFVHPEDKKKTKEELAAEIEGLENEEAFQDNQGSAS